MTEKRGRERGEKEERGDKGRGESRKQRGRGDERKGRGGKGGGTERSEERIREDAGGREMESTRVGEKWGETEEEGKRSAEGNLQSNSRNKGLSGRNGLDELKGTTWAYKKRCQASTQGHRRPRRPRPKTTR